MTAAVLIAVGASAFWLGRWGDHAVVSTDVASGLPPEISMAGHASLRRAVSVDWGESSAVYRPGDVLPGGMLAFEAGVIEIDFFCGATMVVQGPAELDIESDWSVRVDRGKLRANVPPAARGFVVRAAGSDVVDLGTEFALDVVDDNARVEVIDGEVKIRGGDHDGDHLHTDDRRWLRGSEVADTVGVSTIDELKIRQDDLLAERWENWKNSVATLQSDPRLIAYYPIAASVDERVVVDVADHTTEQDGVRVGPVETTRGRFGSLSTGLNFSRPGARVRTRIDGTFDSFTVATWVRIDSLDHLYNALLMSDGYETGDLHWQIRRDGRLMFSIMVDDSQKRWQYNELEQQRVQTAGLHHVYYSDPVWDDSLSGQWMHVAAVYDPAGRRVTQYVNGQIVASEPIVDDYFIETLRIGAAEIGNWGQPFRDTPLFAVRNLNGTIDELAIFGEPLSGDEIRNLYEGGKPVGY